MTDLTKPDPGGSTSSRPWVAFSPATLASEANQARVVLVHGAMDRSASFGRAARLLEDLPVVRYDRRGYGHSTDLGVGDLDAHVEDLVAVMGGHASVLIGHSIGGVIALIAAQRQPALVRSVAAWEAPMPWAPWWPAASAGGLALAAMEEPGPGPAAAGEAHGGGGGDPSTAAPQNGTGDLSSGAAGDAAERFMRKMIGDERWRRLPLSARAQRRDEGRALIADVGSLRGRSAPYGAALLSQPVLAGCGTASVPYHRRAAEELAGSVADGELVTVEGADHGVHISHPREFAKFVRRAVEQAPE